MPNHVENDLYINGPKAEEDALLALIGADQTPPRFDVDAVIPYPAHFAERDETVRAWRRTLGWAEADRLAVEKYGSKDDGWNAGGCDWANEARGTRSIPYQVARRDYGEPCVTFQTAWTPPIPVVAELHRRFPTLTLSLEYFERGLPYCGGVVFVSKDEADENEEPWVAGEPARTWHFTGYEGRRGG
jgi:hypothetical protein